MTTNVNSLLASLPKLDGQNYHDWKFNMSMVLRRAGCWNVVNGTIPRPTEGETPLETKPTEVTHWDSLSEEGLTAIGLAVDQSQVQYIRDCTTGPKAWKALEDIYERHSRANRILLKRQLYTFVHDTSRPIIEYVTGITTLVARLKSIGVTLSDEDVTDILLFALHPSFHPAATTLMHQENLTITSVSATLVEAEEQLNKDQSTPPFPISAYVARARQSSAAGSPHFPIICHRCQAVGHIARNCRAPNPVPSAEEQPEYHAPPPRATPPLAAKVAWFSDHSEDSPAIRLF